VLGYSPLRAAAALLPMALVVIPLSRFAPLVAARLGVRVTGPIGLGLMATGFVVFSTLGTDSSYWHFLAGLLPFGAGMALSGAPATTAIVASLPRDKQGVASAMNDVSRELGGALGIAVLGSVLNTVYRTDLTAHTHALPSALADKAKDSLGAATAIGQRLGAPQLVEHANNAFVHGISVALIAGALALAAGAVFVAVRAPGRAESEANARHALQAAAV
jgi:MFS transporter